MKHTWHAQKSRHNYETYEYLNRKSPDYADWEVISLFYSACKLVDACRIRDGKTKLSNHMKRNSMVELDLPQISVLETVRSEQNCEV